MQENHVIHVKGLVQDLPANHDRAFSKGFRERRLFENRRHTKPFVILAAGGEIVLEGKSCFHADDRYQVALGITARIDPELDVWLDIDP
ncbi:hypothetical protein AA16373_2797 [Komagataeibacter swingsii DSM 16373]|nr:hypothetical protein AA16373_2797 [Komagataeibacter swingsii DSM 16373]